MENTDFIDEPFTVEIRHGFALITRSSGRRAIPLHIFRQEYALAGKALAEFDAGHGVVQIRAGAH